MNKACKDCKFWENMGVLGSCKLAESEDGRKKVKKSKAYALDGEGYHASLITEPDFYCSMFNEKKRKEINDVSYV